MFISDGVKIVLLRHGLGNTQLIACVKTDPRCDQSSSNIHGCTFSNINLKTLTILAKRLILVARLGPGRVYADLD